MTPAPPAPPTLGELLLARAGDERTGILFEDHRWSWADHVVASRRRAAWMAETLTDGPPHVGVLLDNTPEFSFLLGAAALCGAVVVGVNPTRRGSELARDLALTDCRVVLTEQRHAPLLAAVDGPPVVLVDGPGWADAVGSVDADREWRVDDGSRLFMLIFTSGTSGEPKAVRVTDRKVAGPGVAMVQRGAIGRDDVAYLSMPMFHSACIMQGWGPALVAGSAIAMRRRFSASGFLPDVRRYGVTYFHYVGKPLTYILATPSAPDDADNTLRVAAGNEAAPLDVARFEQRFGCEVQEGFGSTEGGVYITRTPDTPATALGVAPEGVDILDPRTGEAVPCARFDADGRLLNADDAIGELVNTAGAGQFAGYYGDAVAEGERMRDGMYWSGDLAYRDDRGFVYFAGRTMDWLRVDGENLGTAPIERVLARYPCFSHVVVYGVPDPAVGDQVMAAVVLRPGAAFDPDDFGAFLRRQADLGSKWAPRYVRVAATLPATETNKVLKRSLAADACRTTDPVFVRESKDLSYRLHVAAGT